jgi:Heparinase II/III-like protein
VLHTRHILTMHGSYWLIIDSLQGTGEHLIEQRFHVVPEARVTLGPGGNFVTISKRAASLTLNWTGQSRVRIDPALAELHCGRPKPSFIVTAAKKSGLPTTLAAACSSARGHVNVCPSDVSDRAGWFVVSGNGFEHRIYAGCDTGIPASLPGGWMTDARFAVIRRSEGQQSDLLLAGARAWREGQVPLPADAESGGKITRVVLN